MQGQNGRFHRLNFKSTIWHVQVAPVG